MEILEIIDSAVKIGLGAAISGFTAYYTSVSQSKHEENKQKKTLKIELLKECAFNLDKASTISNDVNTKIMLSVRDKDDVRDAELDQAISLLGEGYNLLKRSRALIALMGHADLDDLCSKYLKLYGERKNHFLMNRLQLDAEQINLNIKSCEMISMEIHKKLSEIFASYIA